MCGLCEADVLPKRGIHFGTVTPPNVRQRPTFDPESPLLWESSALTVGQSARDPHHCTEVDTPFAGYAWFAVEPYAYP